MIKNLKYLFTLITLLTFFGKANSQREFYSVPGREGVPDQDSFAHWLYRTPSTCKEGNAIACASVKRKG